MLKRARVFITSLLAFATASVGQNVAPEKFAELESRTNARIGVTGIDVSTNRQVAYRAGERFLMCSTFKVLAAAAVMKRVDEKTEKLDRFVRYSEVDLLEYAPVTRAHINDGGMSLEALCAAAVEQSDNTAGNLLLDAVGGPKGVTEFARTLGDKVTRLDRKEPELNNAAPNDERDTTTPAMMCHDLKLLFTSDVLTTTSRSRLEQWMQQSQTGLQMIRIAAPAGAAVADKTGRSSNGATNDIAVVRPRNGEPIFLAIYTIDANDSPDARNTVVAEAAKIAFELLTK